MALFNKSIIEVLRKVLLLQISEKIELQDTKENISRLKSLVGKAQNDRLIEIMQVFIGAGSLLKDVNYPVVPLEIAVVKSTASISKSEFLISNESPKSKIPMAKQGDSSIPQNDSIKVQNESSPPMPKRGGKVAEQSFSDTVPVPVVEMTRDIWQQVIDHLKGENATLAALLRDARPIGLAGDTLHLGVKFKFHQDRISEPKNSESLEKVVCRVMGSNYKVVCKIEDKTSKPILSVKEDIGKAVEEIFEIEG